MKNIRNYLLFFVLVMNIGGAQAGIDVECKSITAEAQVILIRPPTAGPEPVGLGVVAYNIDGEMQFADVTAFIPEPIVNLPDGTMNFPLRLFHDFGQGDSITWRAEVVLTPTATPGIFTLSEGTHIIGGTGQFLGIFGKGNGYGTASFIDFQVMINADGLICEVEDEDED